MASCHHHLRRAASAGHLPAAQQLVPGLSPLGSDPGIVGYAVDLLEFDPTFERAFRVVFGATVVVDTLERARHLMGRYRMVTLDGDFVERSGAMTGGAQKKKIRGFGVAVDDEITRIRATIAGLEVEAAEIGSSIGRFAGISEAKRAERSMVDEQIARYRMLTEEFSKRVDVLGGEKQALEVALRGLLRDAETGGEELARLETDLERIADEIARLSGAVDGLKKRWTIPRSRPHRTSMRISGDLLRYRTPASEQGCRYHRCQAGAPALCQPR